VLAAMLHLDRLRQPERFGPWLAGIGLNVCRVWLRERTRWIASSEVPEGALASAEGDPVDLAVAADVAARVQSAVGALPPGQRAAVALHYLGGLTQAEAAGALGVELGAVKTRLHKARGTLRRSLAMEGSMA